MSIDKSVCGIGLVVDSAYSTGCVRKNYTLWY